MIAIEYNNSLILFAKQKEAAETLNKSPAAVSKALKNNTNITFRNTPSKIFKVSPQEIKRKEGIILLQQGHPKYFFPSFKELRQFFRPITNKEFDELFQELIENFILLYTIK